jgi:LmbE family N-acetylglucosaminyl deacetylase
VISPRRIVVIAPHPDDETLGVGGAIARFAGEGAEVSVLIVSGHLPPLYPPEAFETTRREADAALTELGAARWEFLQIPATMIHERPVAEVNSKIANFVRNASPEMVLLPFPDRHIDHRVVFDASVVACRPTHAAAPKIVLAYETLSETHWNVPGIEPSFSPELFIDITNQIDKKIAALDRYQSQIHAASRSTDACMALAKFRGSQNGCGYAEAFKVVRIVI